MILIFIPNSKTGVTLPITWNSLLFPFLSPELKLKIESHLFQETGPRLPWQLIVTSFLKFQIFVHVTHFMHIC